MLNLYSQYCKIQKVPKTSPHYSKGKFTLPLHIRNWKISSQKKNNLHSFTFIFSSIFCWFFVFPKRRIDDAFRVPRDCGRSRAPRVPIPNPPPKHPSDMNFNRNLGMICLWGITLVWEWGVISGDEWGCFFLGGDFLFWDVFFVLKVFIISLYSKSECKRTL